MVVTDSFVSTRSRPEEGSLRIALPGGSTTLAQDAEWCVVEIDGQWREIRFHDYAEIYNQPGLYEALFYDVLECDSPRFVSGRLMAAVHDNGVDPGELRVLDLGAGNGIMAEQLMENGVGLVIGTDILAAAETAAWRDRPAVYADYLVADMSDLTPEQHARLAAHKPNCLTCVAALGFGDIPPECFRQAFNLVADGGWVAFTIREDFLAKDDTSGFARMVGDAVENDLLRLVDVEKYPHRLAASGEPVLYTSVVGTKVGDLPPVAV